MTLDEDREAGKETHCAEISAIGESSGRQVRLGAVHVDDGLLYHTVSRSNRSLAEVKRKPFLTMKLPVACHQAC